MWHAWQRTEKCTISGGRARRRETSWTTEAYMRGLDHNGSSGDWLASEDWIQLAQDRDQWPALVNTVMGLRVLAQRS
jgi:hypothetical protein